MLTIITSQSLIVPPEKQLLQMPAIAAGFSSEASIRLLLIQFPTFV